MLAYIDSFVGLVPCKVRSVVSDSSGVVALEVRITATRSSYQRGEYVLVLGNDRIVPRWAVCHPRQACGQARIRGAWDWATTADADGIPHNKPAA